MMNNYDTVLFEKYTSDNWLIEKDSRRCRWKRL